MSCTHKACSNRSSLPESSAKVWASAGTAITWLSGYTLLSKNPIKQWNEEAPSGLRFFLHDSDRNGFLQDKAELCAIHWWFADALVTTPMLSLDELFNGCLMNHKNLTMLCSYFCSCLPFMVNLIITELLYRLCGVWGDVYIYAEKFTPYFLTKKNQHRVVSFYYDI